MTDLGDPLRLGGLTAPSRVVFGPHETNLGRARAVSDRHVAYYRARAAGGAGVVVVEEASVDETDWPYERSPLAERSAEGWAAVARACHDEGAVVLAALGHSGSQGSSAYHQQALLAPSRTPDVATREVPKSMEPEEIDALVRSFAAAARLAAEAGLDGVEVNAGQWSLLRQFASGLTNHRHDGYGEDRFRLAAEVLDAVATAAPGGLVGLRACVDELAPWAGIVPSHAAEALGGLAAAAGRLDYVTVVRGSAYGTFATRPDSHVPPGFNDEGTALVRAALPAAVAVVAQGSIVDLDHARRLLGETVADAVELTRAQIADPRLVAKVRSGAAARIRPCVLCNQTCQVRDVRNPIVTCVGEPRSGHETTDADPEAVRDRTGARTGHLLVVGGGPAGLECARVAAAGGLSVTLYERSDRLGGMFVRAAARVPGRERLSLLAEWLAAECATEGVELVTGHEVTLEELDAHDGPVVCCTGSRPGRRTYDLEPPGVALSAADVLEAERLPGDPAPGPVVVADPIGGPIGVGVAELLAALGASVVLATPDFVAGEQLARSGDLAPANVRLARAGVEVAKHTVVRSVDRSGVTIEDRFTGARRLVDSALLVDAGPLLPEDALFQAVVAASQAGRRVLVAGDALAPRTVHEAVLEGRRCALSLLGVDAADPHLHGAHR